ncbi:molybdopterin-synthase adenylyltransferase MoeB [Rhizobiaceae bacterium CRRU44]|uniref:Molybdopterin-synthase adenylyltransferase n=1 Tax=Ferranicluibacter rubi TaxID=2715133 RepID=A0AA44C986_9HYPH|nr:molybdopterin-synthase adenylyltransferase MoeB [Ferranicluibacter rubi]NHT74765.1 molybdopterin-synthase adenylyltransferase MoeB [Ferranicluibacter rubi]
MAEALTPQEIDRYSRHILLPEIGGQGQQALKAARVLVVGAGGLGAPVILYLAAAGIGTLGIVDDDVVSLSNLQRQVVHQTSAIGTSKVDSARDTVARLNPHVTVRPLPFRLTPDTVSETLAGYDIVVDGSDNFGTRYLLAEATETLRIPLVTGAVGRFDGSLTVLMPWTSDAAGRPAPRYRDLFPEPPPPGTVPSCAEAGIVGALTGVIGTLQAMEVVKLVTGAGDPLVGRLLLYDALAARFETILYRRRRADL